MRVGLFGGTFDPIHNGHLKLAQAALKQLSLHKVIFVLTRRNPFKEKGPVTNPLVRKKMLALALKGKKKFSLGLWELKRKGPSFTFKTLLEYKTNHPTHELYLLMGSDLMADFPKWKNTKTILQVSQPVIGWRLGSKKRKQRPPALKKAIFLKGWFPDFSATEIRKKVRKKKSPQSALPLKVFHYIQKNRIYFNDNN